jgi:hypothetical protein
MLKRYIEIAVDVAVAYGAYYLFGWIGLALVVFFVLSWFCIQLIESQRAVRDTLLSRLPDRCTFCHREIVDEGGVFDEDGIYHAACADKLESLEGLRKEAGVLASKAIHKPKPRSKAGMP